MPTPALFSTNGNQPEAEKSWLITSISDNGPGVPLEEQGLIFDRFYRRGVTEQSSTAKGSGLGLPIVRNLVELHGGKVWVKSEVGKGSTFFVKLPLS